MKYIYIFTFNSGTVVNCLEGKHFLLEVIKETYKMSEKIIQVGYPAG